MKTGIITYHSAYNFGSVLQAFATQTVLKGLGIPAEIINYRMAEQKYFYQSTFHPRYGGRAIAKDCLLIPIRRKRVRRAERYEEFFSTHLNLTSEMGEPEEVIKEWGKYDLVISGSDQIWNKHSLELNHNDWRHMDPYLLKGFHGRKVSYASSIGSMTDEELQFISPALQQFDALSFREASTAKRMAFVLGHDVETVIDPTFLLTKENWINALHLQRNEGKRYILAYFLGSSFRHLSHQISALIQLAKYSDCEIRIINPYVYVPTTNKRIRSCHDEGPIEFLNDVYNSEAVVTNSYHGTILAVNFGKEIYSVCNSGGAEFRKTDILERLGLTDRIISDVTQIPDINLQPIDYSSVYAKLDTLRRHSINYLKTALEV